LAFQALENALWTAIVHGVGEGTGVSVGVAVAIGVAVDVGVASITSVGDAEGLGTGVDVDSKATLSAPIADSSAAFAAPDAVLVGRLLWPPVTALSMVGVVEAASAVCSADALAAGWLPPLTIKTTLTINTRAARPANAPSPMRSRR
jgi:hypothetical protein